MLLIRCHSAPILPDNKYHILGIMNIPHHHGYRNFLYILLQYLHRVKNVVYGWTLNTGRVALSSFLLRFGSFNMATTPVLLLNTHV